MKLSPLQEATLKVLLQDGERSSYPGLKIGTLRSLSLKGLVNARHEPGSMAFPANGIKWRLSHAGHRHLVGSGKQP